MSPVATERQSGLLIGGSSCVGKTTVARVVSVRLGFVHIETDRSLPADARLRPLDGSLSVWDQPAKEICEQLISAAEIATPYLMRQAQSLAQEKTGWILEGERVHPELVFCLRHLGLAHGFFVVETNVQRITQTLTERLPKFMSLSVSRRRTVAEVNRLYNLWLIEEATRHNVTCVESQPWTSLAERLIQFISASAQHLWHDKSE